MKSRMIILAILIVGVIVVAAFVVDFTLFNRSSSNTAPLIFDSQVQHSSPYVTEYLTQSASTAPSAIAIDSNGNAWFILQNRSALAELNPSNGTLREFDMPNSQGSQALAWSVLLQESKHLVWFDDQQSNAIWSFNTLTQKFTKYGLSAQNSFPFGMALDKEGNIWFAEIAVNKIGEITAQGNLKEYSLPTQPGITNTGPAGVAVSSAGVVWFTEAYIASIGSYYNGQFQQYNLSGKILAPAGIALDAGGNLWITEHGPNLIAEFNPVSGHFRSISTTVPTGEFASYPYFIYYASDGNLWFNEHYGNSISVFNPRNYTLLEYKIPTRVVSTQNISGATTMILANGTTPWFTELYSGKIGTVNFQQSVPLSLSVQNLSDIVQVPAGKSISLSLTITNQVGSSVAMQASVGNLTETIDNLNFTFSKPIGSGSFTDTITISNKGLHPGLYFVTVSALGGELNDCRVIEINAT